jgi:hypothetical protein
VQYAALPYRQGADRFEILLVTSLGTKRCGVRQTIGPPASSGCRGAFLTTPRRERLQSMLSLFTSRSSSCIRDHNLEGKSCISPKRKSGQSRAERYTFVVFGDSG